MLLNFSIARLPRIEFGEGVLRKLPDIAAIYGKHLLIVTGSASFTDSAAGQCLLQALAQAEFSWEICRVTEEPSPQWVDETVAALRHQHFDLVIGIGGGSPLDAAKAVAGLLKTGHSVLDYLEGVGLELPYQGPATPFIAVPTTAGTGSEATKNAVLSVSGEQGYKKSFRADALVAEYALVDPGLLATCPPLQIAGNGMDAFTQLMESFVSLRANPLTDALALSGMEAARDGLLAWYENPADGVACEKMAYAALLSGICLAQTGLGSVHGIVAPLGAFHAVPHGLGCGMLVVAATRMNIAVLASRAADRSALQKYARVSRLLQESPQGEATDPYLCVDILQSWATQLQLPTLGDFGVSEGDIEHLVAHSRGSSMKTNPVVLSDAEIAGVIRQSL